MAQNAPKKGNPVLSDRQLERLVRAALVAGDGKTKEREVQRAVRWAEKVMVDAGLLGQILDGATVGRWNGRDWEYRNTAVEERRFILDADGKVEREPG